MTVKSAFLTLGLLLTALPSFAADVSLAKAAELGLHRIERLVTLRKIEENFINKLSAVKIERAQEGAAKFKFLGIQSAGNDGSVRQVEIMMDGSGKEKGFRIINGADAIAPQWPQKDPVSLMESAMHYLLDNPTKPEVAPFFNEFTEGSLEQFQDGGQPFVKAFFRSSTSAKVMEVVQKLDGTFVSVTVK